MNQKMNEANKTKRQRTEELVKQHISRAPEKTSNRILGFLKKISLMIKSKERLQKIITKFKNEAIKLKNINTELLKENKSLSQEVDQLSRNNIKLSNDNQNLSAKKDELLTELNFAKDENRQLKKTIRTLERGNNQSSKTKNSEEKGLVPRVKSSKSKRPLTDKIANAYQKLWNRQNEKTSFICKPNYKNPPAENIIPIHQSKKPKKHSKKGQKSDPVEKLRIDIIESLNIDISQLEQLKTIRVFIVCSFPNDTLKKILPVFDDESDFTHLPDCGKNSLTKTINKVRSILSNDEFNFVIVSPYLSHGLLYPIRTFENYKDKVITVPKNTTKFYPVERILKKLS